jgi:7-cyano-7-deazaguanine reductase
VRDFLNSKIFLNPLGRATPSPRDYAPEMLYAVSRGPARQSLGIGAALPFQGEDLWNAWELSWLDPLGRPVVAVAELRVPASSPNLIESKSLKLYLNSLAETRYASALPHDISRISGIARAALRRNARTEDRQLQFSLARICIDSEPALWTQLLMRNCCARPRGLRKPALAFVAACPITGNRTPAS